MRTWSGIVDIWANGERIGQAHADLAAEKRENGEEWWGQLRGAARLGLDERETISLRLPDGTTAEVDHAVTSRTDLYHRTEVDGIGPVPF